MKSKIPNYRLSFGIPLCKELEKKGFTVVGKVIMNNGKEGVIYRKSKNEAK